jgi:hypothetical protein
MHDLLPWHLNATLAPDEDRAFRAHLDECADCRADLERLRALRDELSRHGAVLLGDHPDPEQLVAIASGEMHGTDARAVEAARHHVELCDACATELRWIRGEAVVGPDAPQRAAAPSWRVLAWAASAAAAASLVTALFVSRDETAPATGIVRQHWVIPTERADDTANVFELRPGEDAVHLLLEADLPAAAFPVTVRITNERGEVVHEDRQVSRDVLVEGLHVSLRCSIRDCPPGAYDVEIVPSSPGEPPIRHRFRLR